MDTIKDFELIYLALFLENNSVYMSLFEVYLNSSIKLTNSMQQSPWEANNHSASHEIPRLL
jgi:hypothetical protein